MPAQLHLLCHLLLHHLGPKKYLLCGVQVKIVRFSFHTKACVYILKCVHMYAILLLHHNAPRFISDMWCNGNLYHSPPNIIMWPDTEIPTDVTFCVYAILWTIFELGRKVVHTEYLMQFFFFFTATPPWGNVTFLNSQDYLTHTLFLTFMENMPYTSSPGQPKYSPTRTFAAGLSTPMDFKMVAPSLVTWIPPGLWGDVEIKILSWVWRVSSVHIQCRYLSATLYHFTLGNMLHATKMNMGWNSSLLNIYSFELHAWRMDRLYTQSFKLLRLHLWYVFALQRMLPPPIFRSPL